MAQHHGDDRGTRGHHLEYVLCHGGEDLEDLLDQTARVNMVHLPARQANAQAVPPIEQRNEVRADSWELGLQKVRAAINKTITPVMLRLKLWYETPQGDNFDS